MYSSEDYMRAYAEHYGITIKDAMHECARQWEFLKHMLYDKKEDITIYGFGAFKQKLLKPKRVRIPGTDNCVVAPQKRVVKFIQSGKTIDKI